MRLEIVRSDFEKYYNDISLFCLTAIEEMKSASYRDVEQTIKNMDYDTWVTNNHCLLYRIYVKRDFSWGNGMLCLLYDNDQIVSVSGASKYNDDIAMLARRQYTLNAYKGKGIYHKYSMDVQIEWSKEANCKACVILINEYNKVLYNMLRRIPQGKATYFGGPAYDKYKSFIDLGGPYKINGADQYVMLKKLNPSFDERDIKWKS